MIISWWKRRRARQITAILGEGTRLCKDCRWCRASPADMLVGILGAWGRPYYFATCKNPKISEAKRNIDEHTMIDGRVKTKMEYFHCATQRRSDCCGRTGRAWEAK
jgi:hypothetical protein